MTNAGLDTLSWLLIYGGLLLLCLALFVLRTSAPFGWTLIVLGAAAAAVGAVLVWVRSRRSP